jgi:hypothetical protein
MGDYNTPTLVLSYTDFVNQFGTSPSANSVKLYFRNNPVGPLYFSRVEIAPRYLVTVDSVAAGDYVLDVDGTSVSVTAVGTETAADLASSLLSSINTAVQTARAAAGTDTSSFYVIEDDPAGTLTVTVTTGTMTATSSTPSSPAQTDYIYCIEHSFDVDDNWPQGFVLCPEAFQLLSNAVDRLAVGNALESLASADGFDWVSLIDSGAAITTTAELLTDSVQYVSAKGHSSYYAPYLIDLEGNQVPPSAAVAAVAAKRYATEGFPEPIGSKRYPIAGVTDVVTRYNNTQQGAVNDSGVNLIRNLRGKGICIWGMRTRSTDALYKFTHTRVIMNVLNGSLRVAFDEYPLSSIDGIGVLLHNIESTAVSVCRKLYRAQALFGASEEDAFQCECSFNNNAADDLENGNVLLTVYVAPVPGLEKLIVATYRVGIGQVQSSAQAGFSVTA